MIIKNLSIDLTYTHTKTHKNTHNNTHILTHSHTHANTHTFTHTYMYLIHTHSRTGGHHFYAMCWRGVTRTINVMCGKVEIESMKHQLTALGVLRPKIAAIRREELPALLPHDAADADADAAPAATSAVDVTEEVTSAED